MPRDDSRLTAAFRRLEHALLRRRVTRVETRLAIEIVALVVLASGFVFWQSRVLMASVGSDRGPAAVALTIAAKWALIGVTAGATAGAAIAHALRTGPAGFAWLSLPIPAHRVMRHVAWNARVRALWPVLFAPPVLIAAIGLIMPWWIVFLAAVLAWLVIEATRLGCAISWRLVLRETERRALPPAVRLLSAAARQASAAALPPARWRRASCWVAHWRKDLLVARRAPAVRRRLVAALVPAALSVAAWWLPGPAMARVLAFALALVSAAAFGEWVIALVAADPFAFLRAQPCAMRDVWRARMTWAALAALLLGGLHLALGHPLSLPARVLFAAWTAVATFTIVLLAAHYALTLYPHGDRAARMLSLTLGLAMAASLMIPLAGWIILLTALIHSVGRLPRWTRLEPAA
jgi:hypothetical protein